ncbi:MAG: Xaa-Pro peptidase family protein [Pseudomonadota bacterium]
MPTELALPRVTYDQRWAELRDFLAAQALDCALILGPEAQYWLCGYDTFLGAVLPQALIFPANGAAPVLAVWDADVAIARQTSLIGDIRTYRFGVDAPAEVFAALAREMTGSVGRIGLDLTSHTLPYGFGAELVDRLAGVGVVAGVGVGVGVVDIAPDLAALRQIKTPEELALMRKAGACGAQGLAAAAERIRPGMTEIALAAEIEYAMRRAGSDYPATPAELASGPRSVQGHGTPGDRVLAPGDLVHIEIGGAARRYHAVAIQTMVVPGAPPPPGAEALYDLARACLQRGLAQLGPGVAAAEVEAPALELLRAAGGGDNFKMRFGYGVGIGYPPSWLEPLKITRTSTDVLTPGTCFVLHACLLDAAAELGVLVGGTYAITESGYEMLAGAGDVDLLC